MRPEGSAAELERRRVRAVELIEQGESPSVVARILGADRSSLYRWCKAARSRPDGLAAKPHPGRTPRLSDAQLTDLKGLLLRGATAHGWVNDLWTAARVTMLIQRHFEVRLHPDHVSRILKERLNWSSQRPQRQHPDGNDEALALWVKEEFPRILGEAAGRNAHLAFVDETGFMLNPLVRRTYAPEGKRP